MNYKVKAFKVYSYMGKTKLDDYEKEVPNYLEACKEENRLRSLGEYVNIRVEKNNKPLY